MTSKIPFHERFPQTVELLDNAMPEVFPAYDAGLTLHETDYTHSNGAKRDSLFDLASLTKVLCTTTIYAILEEQNVLSIREPVQAYFPDFPSQDVTLSHLLNHSGGFEAWLPMHEKFHKEEELPEDKKFKKARKHYEKTIIKSWKPDHFEKKIIYSDLGFMLLGWAIEEKMGKPLNKVFEELVTNPLQMTDLKFLPPPQECVPTEQCPWRKRQVRGEVHDDNCYVLGGVAGHAGLFGTASAVLKLSHMWLAALNDMPSLINAQTAMRYWNSSHLQLGGQNTRVLGWDGVTVGASSSGRFLSEKARGHLGFTGTSLWIDPKLNLIVTLLTNRVNPSRDNDKIKEFRPVFHDTILRELAN